ncbi:hypothetical protein I4U23_015804 [Adineta vaga]|nr:hypothetical protein I4U23_015804 [Adineta vaga]
MTITLIEDLSNEIFLEIFHYLDGCDILKSFFNLNIRFQRFLIEPSLTMKVKLSTQTKFKSEQIILPCKKQIRSLYLSGDCIIHQFFTIYPIDSLFDQLESLNVQFIRTDQLLQLLRDLSLVSSLRQLIVHSEDDENDLMKIYAVSFGLPSLRSLKVSSLQQANCLFLSLFEPILQTSSIKYLIIDHPCTDHDILTILSSTPYLSHLTCRKSVNKSWGLFYTSQSITMSDLIYLSVQQCLMTFDDFEIFIQRISSKLQILKIVTFNDSSYLNANRWEQLISTNMLLLRKFYFEYHEYYDENYMLTSNHRLTNQFTCQFWLQRQWIFDIRFANLEIIYSVNPYRKQCSELEECKTYYSCYVNEDVVKCDPQIQLILTIHLSESLNNKLSTSILTKLIHKLSYLKFLRMSCLPVPEKENWLTDKRQIIRLSQKNQSITKVYLDSISEVEQIQLAHYLCPFVQYLIINCVDNINLELLIQFMFKTNAKFIKYLNLLCLSIPSIRGETIEKLWKIVNTGRHKYTTEHTRKIITFQRKI